MTLSPRLLNHRARVWRASVTLGDLREEIRGWAVVSTIRCTLQRPSARLVDQGGGLASMGERVLYANPDEDLLPRDVLELIEGPDAGGKFEIDAPITTPRGHHIEATCRLFLGVLA